VVNMQLKDNIKLF